MRKLKVILKSLPNCGEFLLWLQLQDTSLFFLSFVLIQNHFLLLSLGMDSKRWKVKLDVILANICRTTLMVAPNFLHFGQTSMFGFFDLANLDHFSGLVIEALGFPSILVLHNWWSSWVGDICPMVTSALITLQVSTAEKRDIAFSLTWALNCENLCGTCIGNPRNSTLFLPMKVYCFTAYSLPRIDEVSCQFLSDIMQHFGDLLPFIPHQLSHRSVTFTCWHNDCKFSTKQVLSAYCKMFMVQCILNYLNILVQEWLFNSLDMNLFG